MEPLRIIAVVLLVGVGLIALLGDLLERDTTFGFVVSFVFVRFIGILLIYFGYKLYKSEDFQDNYLDDDMDRLA